MSVLRYVKSIGGNASVSFASLTSASVVLSVYNIADFGFYSLVLIFSAFIFSVVNALFVASMQDFITNIELNDSELATFVICNICIINFMAFLFTVYTQVYYQDWSLSISIFFFLTISGIRWLFKAYRQMISDVNGYVLSDAILSIAVIVLSVMLLLFKNTLEILFWLLTGAQLLSMLPLKAMELFKTFYLFSCSSLRKFVSGFNLRGKDALIGSFALELSQNSHSYLITFFAGPQAFAPVALANLLLRPFAVVMAGLVQSERPIFSKLIAEKKLTNVKHACRKLQNIVLASLSVNLLLSILLMFIFSQQLAVKVVDVQFFYVVFGFMVIVSIFKAFRFPLALLLQSLSLYDIIKNSVLVSGVVSVSTVFVLLFFGYTEIALSGLLLGEIAMFILLKHLSKRQTHEF